ncbi:hypothetical protein LTR86_008450 [Recurvomyces mirabilis]|nr:hypothetical protein LTR86_008450 [Recurvomyces mirabilis]
MTTLNSIGLFTQAGWLYEGNYPEWRSRIAALDALKSRAHGNTYLELFFEREDRLMALMLDNISPHLLDRVPDQDRETSKCLEADLLARCRPFRLFALPVEVRSAIYGYTMPNCSGMQHELAERGGPEGFFPPLLYASSATRAEALPIFFIQTHFASYTSFFRQCSMVNDAVGWFRIIDKRCYRHMRRFTLGFYIDEYMRCFDVTISHSPAVGLEVKFVDDENDEDDQIVMDKGFRGRFVDHIANVESTRKILGLQGEAIVMAITSCPELWASEG